MPAAAGPTTSVLAAASRLDALLAAIQPSPSSEFRRLTIAHYICGIIKRCFLPHQVEAFLFGSVPLRAVLPDGDIDISVFTTAPAGGAGSGSSSSGSSAAGGSSLPGPPPVELRDTWASQLLRALEREASRPDAPFKIRDVQIIQAEVKLVKCVVSDVVVDVSFDTVGGLCTVAFLEAADRRIGRQHLFKRSILLLKAWCYYESRLLGAHHGLISSYALEVLVLYIFNLHHAELHTPLDVLRRFLSVLGSFDWEHFCLALQGPLPLAQLHTSPRVETSLMPAGSSPLLDDDFMRRVLQQYSVQQYLAPQQQAGLAAAAAAAGQPPTSQQADGSSGGSSNGAAPPPLVAPHFPLKHLNIVDPLLPSNNLGRSVSKASYARVRKALALGSRTLEAALLKDPRSAVEAVDQFFRNTWRSPVRMAADNQTFLARLSSAQLPPAATEAVVAAATAAGFPLAVASPSPPSSRLTPTAPVAPMSQGLPSPVVHMAAPASADSMAVQQQQARAQQQLQAGLAAAQQQQHGVAHHAAQVQQQAQQQAQQHAQQHLQHQQQMAMLQLLLGESGGMQAWQQAGALGSAASAAALQHQQGRLNGGSTPAAPNPSSRSSGGGPKGGRSEELPAAAPQAAMAAAPAPAGGLEGSQLQIPAQALAGSPAPIAAEATSASEGGRHAAAAGEMPEAAPAAQGPAAGPAEAGAATGEAAGAAGESAMAATPAAMPARAAQVAQQAAAAAASATSPEPVPPRSQPPLPPPAQARASSHAMPVLTALQQQQQQQQQQHAEPPGSTMLDGWLGGRPPLAHPVVPGPSGMAATAPNTPVAAGAAKFGVPQLSASQLAMLRQGMGLSSSGHGRWSPTAAASPAAGALTVGSPAGPVFSAPRSALAASPRLDSPYSFFGGDLEAMERNLLVARRRQRALQHAQQLQQQPAQSQQPVPPPPPPPPQQQQHKAQPVEQVETGADGAVQLQPQAPQLPSSHQAEVEARGKHADEKAQLTRPSLPSGDTPAPAEPQSGQPGNAAAHSGPGEAQQGSPHSQPAARPAPRPLPIVPEAAAVPGTETRPLAAEATAAAGAEGCDLTAAMAALPAVRTSRGQRMAAGATGRSAPPALPPQQPVVQSPSRQPRSPAQPQPAPRSPHPQQQQQHAPRSPGLQQQQMPPAVVPPPLPIVPRGPASDGQRSPKTFAAALRASSRSSSSTSLASPAAGPMAAAASLAAASLASSPSKSASGTPLASGAASRRPAWGRGSSGNLAALGSAPGAPSPASAAPAGPGPRSWSAIAAGAASANAPPRKSSSARGGGGN